MKNYKQFWNGDLTLKESFWSWFMLPEGILYFILRSELIQNKTDVLLIMTIKILYSIFSIIGAWRSSTKYIYEKKIKKDSATWGFIAKGPMVVSAIESIVFLMFIYLIITNSPLLKIISDSYNL